MRRVPAAIAPSWTTLTRPISPGRRDMGARAELAAVAADVDDAHDLPVLLAEEGERALGLLVKVHLVGLDPRVVEDPLVDELLDLAELGVGHGLKVREVEAQPVRGVERARLADVGAEDLAQRPVQQVRRRVVALDGPAPAQVHGELGAAPRPRGCRRRAGEHRWRWRPALSLTVS
jgi:hypothetical protein